jgi:hypothetical protein
MGLESIFLHKPSELKTDSPDNALKTTNVAKEIQKTVDCSFVLATV